MASRGGIASHGKDARCRGSRFDAKVPTQGGRQGTLAVAVGGCQIFALMVGMMFDGGAYQAHSGLSCHMP